MEVSAEVHFAQKLASNEKKIRDRAVKRLQKYLSVRSNQKSLSDADLIKIWKGLFYCMWMQDKPLIQEELSKRITNLLYSFPSTREALRFVKACLETYSREWHGIDRLRLDKFMMMLRDMLLETFTLLSKDGWQVLECRAFATFVKQHVMDPNESRLPDGLKLHLSEIFIDEIVKVSSAKLDSKKMVILLQPFIHYIIQSNKIEVVKRIMSDTVHKVCNTMTKAAIEKKEKKQTTLKGKKGKTEDNDQSDEDNSEDEEEMDVDEQEHETEKPPFTFVLDMEPLFMNLFKQAREKNVRAPNRAVIYGLMKRFPEVFQNVTSKINSQCADEQDCDLDGNDLCLHWIDGKATGKQQEEGHIKKRRKRRQKRKDDLQQQNTIHGSKLAMDVGATGDGDIKEHIKVKIHKTENNPGHLENSVVDSSVKTSKKKKKKAKASKDEDLKNKKRHSSDELVEMTEVGADPPVSENDRVKTKTKKRKRLSEDSVSPLVAKKKSKLSTSLTDDSVDLTEQVTDVTPKRKKEKLKKSRHGGNDSSITSPVNSQSEIRENLSTDRNTNSNARPNSKARVSSNLVTPVELVVYPSGTSTILASGNTDRSFVSQALTQTVPVKSSKKKFTASSPLGQDLDPYSGHAGKGDMKEASTSSSLRKDDDIDTDMISQRESVKSVRKSTTNQAEKVSDIVISSSTVSLLTPKSKKDCSRKAQVQASAETSIVLKGGKESDGNSSNIVKEFCTAMSTPCSMVKKAIAMVSANSAPEPNIGKKIQFEVADESMTPAQKKKVVFNLRKNKANKFKDYLKSLENQPDSPFEPSKSPSFGILKSPAPSPISSKMDLGGDEANDVETNRARKKKALSRRRASAPGGMDTSNNTKQKRQSLSPQASVQRTKSSPSPVDSKSRLKSKGKK